ncbi:gas vesicle protein GvpJ [Nocardioides sp. DS6]|uniref:Gas vesicle protein A n=1 Tax=Nocardioides eburneus TaxID=3231482 RepID=A0ABV3T661_9ACTN
MTTQTSGRRQGGYLERPAPSSLADVIEVILDKGMVIDAYVRVSLVGIELLTIDARIVIASVDTYLRFAEATNRLDLYEHGAKDIGEVVQDLRGSGGTESKTRGALRGAKDSVKEAIGKGDDEDDESDQDERRPTKRSSSSRRRSE